MDMYYSLVVRADESLPMPADRMFEETNRDIASHFMLGDKPNLPSLSRYPVILVKEFSGRDTSTEAIIGYMDDPSTNPRVGHPVLRFPASVLVDRGMLASGWGGSRTRWIVCEGDPYRLLAGVAAGGPAIEKTIVNERQIAVMMPFANDASIDPVYQAMEEGARKADFRCVRVDQLMAPADITDDIRKLIVESRAVIADLSGMNLNVMYELGFAHGNGKKVVLVSSDSLSELPFDIRSHRVLSYQKSKVGLDELSSKIASALENIG